MFIPQSFLAASSLQILYMGSTMQLPELGLGPMFDSVEAFPILVDFSEPRHCKFPPRQICRNP